MIQTLPQNPIFIVGYPRSGTTLVQALLSTQESIYSLPETHFFNIINRLAIQTNRDGNIIKEYMPKVFDRIYDKMNLKFNPEQKKYLLKQVELKKCTPKDLFEYLVLQYIGKTISKNSTGNSFRWVEKTPNHAYFLDTIVSYYPRAQFINIVRHPVAAIYSRKLNFPFNREKPIDWLISQWRRSIETTDKFALRYPEKSITIKYEDLTANLEKECNRISEFIKKEFDFLRLKEYPVVLNHLILSTETWKKKNYKQRIQNTNRTHFKSISVETADYIEDQISDLMEAYHYQSYKEEVDDTL